MNMKDYLTRAYYDGMSFNEAVAFVERCLGKTVSEAVKESVKKDIKKFTGKEWN